MKGEISLSLTTSRMRFLLTRRGLSLFIAEALVFFGIISGCLQIAFALWPSSITNGIWLLAVSVAMSAFIAAVKVSPGDRVTHTIPHPNVTISVCRGDLLTEDAHLIIGFTDTFDTDPTDGIVISPSSVQGQFQSRFYANALSHLDSDLVCALQDQEIVSLERRESKARGKLDRYQIGTVATLNLSGKRVFCVAYGRMGNDFMVRSDVDTLWISLSRTWEAVRHHGDLQPVAIPVIGSEMARVTALSRESLLKMIILSFVAHSRQQLVTRSLSVVIHPKDFTDFDMLEIRSFLHSL
ncbi:macro domain-containing protein [Streptomyces sp. NPDC048288]|uniref:macro domain-containing protein n=1 Tax=Streptomyces sp. NPDC048288 TaxID=3365529 RepID=UPI0037165A10